MTRELLDVLAELKGGATVLVIDDAASETSAYFVSAAHSISAEDICFYVNDSRGVICAAVPEERIRELGLPRMAPKDRLGSPDLTVSVEARQGVTTGISAADRARTLRTLAKTKDPKRDLVTPGHIFPVRAKRGGVLVRASIAEAAVDLLTLAELPLTAAFSHCLDESGALLNEQQIESLRQRTKISSVRISEIIRYRLASETVIERIAEARLPTKHAGEFRAVCFRSRTDDAEHLALIKGDVNELDRSGEQLPILARVQTANRIGDLFGTDHRPSRQLALGALQEIDRVGRGVFVYIRHPERKTLRQREEGSEANTSEESSSLAKQLREFGIGAQILSELGVERIRLLSNSQRDVSGVSAFRLEILDRVQFSAFEGTSEGHQ